MFGRLPTVTPFQCPYKFDTTTYASHLQAKLQAMQDFVHTNLTKSPEQQKRQYDRHTFPTFLQPWRPRMAISTYSQKITTTMGWKMDCK